MKRKLELLAPAGTFETLKAVIHAGADAVYFGGSRFGARAYAGNFDTEEVLRAIDYGHIHGVKVILAVNTLLKQAELEQELYAYLLPFYERGLDAVIVQDFGVMAFIRKYFPGLPIHTSTQMTVTGVDGARFLAKQGADRIVMARELSFEEVHAIHEAVPVELEGFVHGALCYCYSGQCLLSSMLGGRSGNRGRCAQPCRLPYEVCRDGKKVSGRGQEYPLSPKDLCTIQDIPRLAECGIYSFKIEGRMKSSAYAAGVVSVYRQYMDRYLSDGAKGYRVDPEDFRKLLDLGNRSGFTDGYYHRHNGAEMITFSRPGHEKSNEQLFSDITETYIHTDKKKKIRGIFTAVETEPVSLQISCDSHWIQVTGEVPFPAKKQAATEEDVREKLMRTGQTPFVFEQLDAFVGEGLFLPVRMLNDLRREALAQLEKELTQPFFREVQKGPDEEAGLQQEESDMKAGLQRVVPDEENELQQKNSDTENEMPQGKRDAEGGIQQMENGYFAASVERMEQFQAVLKAEEISVIYADSTLFAGEDMPSALQEVYDRAHQAGKELHVILPAVFREKTRQVYQKMTGQLKADGFLVKSYDALGFLLESGMKPQKIRIDHNLYTWSNQSKAAFLSTGICGDTVPLELNRKELARRDNRGSEMLLYGYLPLMTTAQCVNRNLCGCDKTAHFCQLKDRYGTFFPVKNNCADCYNVIYNSRPQYLFGVFAELKEMGFAGFRLSFTVETAKETAGILRQLKLLVSGKTPEYNMEEYTYGHYRRGVE